MSGDHNMNQTDSAWRKRQIALNKKAENARELGLDYEPSKTIMDMALEAGCVPYWHMSRLERFAALVRADEAEKYKWDVHSCGPTCTKVACVAVRESVREAVLAEREQCLHAAEVAASLLNDPIAAIRARGQA